MATRKQDSDGLRRFRSSRAYRLGSLLRQLHLDLTEQVEARLDAAGVQFTRTQGLALMLLAEHPGASNAELARFNGVSPQTMHQVMARLERDGLVKRTPHPRLGRVQAFAATARGMALLERGSAVAHDALEDSLRGLRVADQEALAALLERWRASLPPGGRD